MSYVFLVGEYVCKVKKPVTLVDLDGVPILRDGQRFLLGDESRSFDPSAYEYTVKMRRLPEDRMLDRLVRADEVDTVVIDALAQRLASFHRGASTAAGWRYGSAPAIRAANYLHAHNVQVREFPQVGPMLQALQSKSVDAVVFDSPVFLYYAAHDGKGTIKLVGPEFNVLPISFGFQLNSPLLRKVNVALLSPCGPAITILTFPSSE